MSARQRRHGFSLWIYFGFGVGSGVGVVVVFGVGADVGVRDGATSCW